MGVSRDIEDQNYRVGSSGSSVSSQGRVNAQASAEAANRNPMTSTPIKVRDEAADNWANPYISSKVQNSYFDHFYSGQDIRVYIDGADSDESIPIMQLAYNIQQQKTPLYGYASYAYDAMMRGTRIVSGVMRITTTDVHYMTQKLSEAARTRKNREAGLYQVRGLTESEELIEKYWTKNIDPEVAFNNNKHLWSSHPPFNLVIIYGMQETSVVGHWSKRTGELLDRYVAGNIDNVLHQDTNERLVEEDTQTYAQRILLENIELTGLQIEYTPDGQVCSEVYSFLARDMKQIRV